MIPTLAAITNLFKNPNPKELETSQATSTGTTGSRLAYNIANPSKSLNPSTIATLCAQVYQGKMRDYLALAEQMEEKYPAYRDALTKRKQAVASLPLIVKPASDDKASRDMSAAVQAMVNSPVVRRAIINMQDAIAKGYSVCEIAWDTSGKLWKPSAIIWKDPAWFMFQTSDAETLFLRGDSDTPTPLDSYKFIIHRPTLKSGIIARNGLAFALMSYYLFQAADVADWMAYIDKFGYPLIHAKYPSNATDAQITQLRTAASKFGTDQTMVSSKDVDVAIVEAKGSGVSGKTNFESFVDWINKQAITLILGQNMTTQDGASLSQSKVHEGTLRGIIQSDAMELAETLNESLVKWFVDFNFGQQEAYPTVEFFMEDKVPIEVWIKAVTDLVPLGLPVPVSEVYARLGITPPSDKNTPVLNSPPNLGGLQYTGKPRSGEVVQKANQLAHLIAKNIILAAAQKPLAEHPADQLWDNTETQNQMVTFSTELDKFLTAKFASMTEAQINAYLDSGAIIEEFDFGKFLGDPLAMQQFKAATLGNADFDKVAINE